MEAQVVKLMENPATAALAAVGLPVGKAVVAVATPEAAA
jgi:hypothetical protein